MLGWTVDSDLLGELKGANAETLSGLDDTIKSAKEQYGDSELKDAKFAKAHHFSRIGDYVSALLLLHCSLTSVGMHQRGLCMQHTQVCACIHRQVCACISENGDGPV